MKKYAPWLMVFMAMLTMTISNGMTISGISVFDESLIKEFGWARADLKFRDLITFAVAGLLSPLAGVLIDKFGVRKAITFGFILLSAGYFFYSRMNSLADLYIVHTIFGVVVIFCGLNACMILVSSWFKEKRGTAIGFALAGSSLGGVLLPQLGTYLINNNGWRNAYFMEMFIAIAMIFMTVLLVRNRPANIATVDNSDIVATDPSDISYGAALRTKTFWALTIIAMTTFYSVLGAQAHLFLYLRDLEFSIQTATNAISILFGAGLVGKMFFGLLADHIPQKKVLIANIIVMLGGGILLAIMNSDLIWYAVVAFGFGWGGIYTLLQLTAVNSFGLTSAGKILGTITVLDALGGGMGIWLTGVLFETNGKSYELAFQIFCALLIIALLAATQIQPVKKDSTQHH